MASPSRKKPKFATYNQVANAAKNWADPVLLCRTKGHSWDQTNAIYIERLRYWQVHYDCTRGCGVKNYQEWDQRGVPYVSWMIYPRDEEGNELYLAVGIGRVVGETRGALRIESVTRKGFERRTGRASDEDMPRSQITREAISNGSVRKRTPAKKPAKKTAG